MRDREHLHLSDGGAHDALAAGSGVDVAWKPFSLGPIFAARGLSTSPFNVEIEKGAHMWRDVARQAEELGRTFRKPSTFPRNTIGALRVGVLGVERAWGPAFVRAALRRTSSRTGPSTRRLCSTRSSATSDSRARPSAPRHRRRSGSLACGQTDQAKALGIFGAPTLIASGELFWGNDRLESALRWMTRARAGREGR